MPYATYHTEQWYNSYGMNASERYSFPQEVFSAALPKNKFTPAQLVRVSDMVVVPGNQVDEGYCALSYSWDWSGESVKNETTLATKQIDKGNHRIVYGQDEEVSVNFRDLLQLICRDFNIRYIWYDKMCINQENQKTKQQDIQQIHQIYRNAHCTVALVPEFRTRGESVTDRCVDIGSMISSTWFKRMWTLEEAVLSSTIVVVGRDVHTWNDVASFWLHVGAIFDKPSRYNASTILHYAHIRRTARQHDRIFALFNIYPDLRLNFSIDYEQDLDYLMIRFYKLLAKKDLSILCFGNYNVYQYIVENEVTDKSSHLHDYIPIREFGFLPSWTGIEGEHFHHNCDSGGLWETDFQDYRFNESILQVTCVGIPLHPSHVSNIITLQQYDLPRMPGGFTSEETPQQQQQQQRQQQHQHQHQQQHQHQHQRELYQQILAPRISVRGLEEEEEERLPRLSGRLEQGLKGQQHQHQREQRPLHQREQQLLHQRYQRQRQLLPLEQQQQQQLLLQLGSRPLEVEEEEQERLQPLSLRQRLGQLLDRLRRGVEEQLLQLLLLLLLLPHLLRLRLRQLQRQQRQQQHVDDYSNYADIFSRQESEYILEDIQPIPDNTAVLENIDKRWELLVEVQTPRNNERKYVLLGRFGDAVHDDVNFRRAANNFQLLSLFMPIQKGNLSWWDRRTPSEKVYSSIGPFLTEYITDYHNILQDYVLLAGIPFRDRGDIEGLTLYPVIRRLENGYYKAVGTVGAFGLDYFLDGHALPPKQEYNIQ